MAKCNQMTYLPFKGLTWNLLPDNESLEVSYNALPFATLYTHDTVSGSVWYYSSSGSTMARGLPVTTGNELVRY